MLIFYSLYFNLFVNLDDLLLFFFPNWYFVQWKFLTTLFIWHIYGFLTKPSILHGITLTKLLSLSLLNLSILSIIDSNSSPVIIFSFFPEVTFVDRPHCTILFNKLLYWRNFYLVEARAARLWLNLLWTSAALIWFWKAKIHQSQWYLFGPCSLVLQLVYIYIYIEQLWI